MGVLSNIVRGQDNTARKDMEKESNATKHTIFLKVGYYVVLILLWTLISDKLISLIVKLPNDSVILYLIKRISIIIMSTFLIYHLISRNLETIAKLNKKVDVYEEQYKFVINNTTDGLWDWDITTNKVLLPNKWKSKLGYNDQEIENTVEAWEKLIHPEDYQKVNSIINAYIHKEIPEYRIEYRVIRKDGSIMWVQDSGQALWDKNGRPIRVSGIHVDITERKEAEEALFRIIDENKRLLLKSQEHERLQAEFFSNISHEFKTPLNVILGTIQLIDSYQQDDMKEVDLDSIMKWIPMMKQNCFRLQSLINNLLYISKLEADALNIKYKNYNIIYIVEEITQSIAILAQNKGITITFDTDVEEKIMAADISVIERIMLNLLSNAIKYTEVGENVYVTVMDQSEYILISIKDTGIGIPQDKVDIIFDRFRQVDVSLHRKVEGTGIGLSLVKSLVDKLNGEIWVETRKGIGSEFMIKLPVFVLEEDSIALDSIDYNKNLVEKICVELSDIYSL